MNDYFETRNNGRNTRLFSNVRPTSANSDDLPASTASDASSSRNEKAKFNIQKSLKLLDDAVGTPRQLRTASPLLRRAGTPAPLLKGPQPLLRTLKHSSYTTSGQSSIADGDFDLQNASYLGWNGNTPGTPMLGTSPMFTGNTTGKHFDGTISLMDDSGYTKPVTPTGQYFLEDVEDKTADISQLTGYSEKDAIQLAHDTLLEGFTNSVTTLSHSSQVFELAEEYEKLCNNAVITMHCFIRKTTPGRSRFSKRVQLMNTMNQEKYTWRLIASLFRDRLENESMDEEDVMSESLVREITHDKSEKEIIEALYKRESLTRQNQMVIDWLEKNNEDFLDNFVGSQNVEILFYNWENTLHSLEQAGTTSLPERPFVTEMDPDASVRQNRPIAHLDVEDENRLFIHVFAYIRAGKLQQAQDLCVKCGQAWRAASMEGWKLYHNPNTSDKDSERSHIKHVEGNPNRDIWKNCCWQMSEQECYHMYERAIYAALGGNLGQLLRVCTSWEDYLWAYCKVMVDVRVEQELRFAMRRDRAWESLSSEYWDQLFTPEKIFAEIHASSNEKMREASKTHFHIVQKQIILNNIEALIEEMYSWVQSQDLSSQMLRFMTHLILFLRSTGLEKKSDMCNSIIEAFVECLIKEKKLKLVAVFTSHLPPASQVNIYARFLEDVTDSSERKLCFEMAVECGLDIAGITKTVVENIRGQDDFPVPTEDSPSLQGSTSEEDKKKIEAIEWLVFDPSQRAEAIKQSNAMMRCFLAMRKHEAARNAFDQLPEDSIDVVHHQWQMRAGDSPLTSEDSNSVREYFCIKAYLDALETFNLWFEHFHRNAPREPVNKGIGSFTEKVAFEQELKHYQAEKERWQRALDIRTKETTNRIYNVLHFPAGWMVDLDEEDEVRETRIHQMDLLRQLCIPFVTFLLQSILSSTNQNKECLQIADIIASEKYKLYEVFRKDELQKLLSLLRASSIDLLDSCIDPLGYEMQ